MDSHHPRQDIDHAIFTPNSPESGQHPGRCLDDSSRADNLDSAQAKNTTTQDNTDPRHSPTPRPSPARSQPEKGGAHAEVPTNLQENPPVNQAQATVDNYRHLDGGDRFSSDKMETNYRYVQLWGSWHPPEEMSERELLSYLSAARGESLGEARDHLRVSTMLRAFPQLHALALQLKHLCPTRLRAIEKQVCGVRDVDKRKTLDAMLVEFFTPTVPNEVLPQAQTITKRVREMVLQVDPGAVAQKKDMAKRTASVRRGEPGFTRFSFHLPDDEAREVRAFMDTSLHRITTQEHARARAEKRTPAKLDLADSLLAGIRSHSKIKVVHNTFTRDGVLFLNGVGPLDDDQAARFREAAIERTLDVDASVEAYQVPERMRTTVELYDGHCRFPNCDAPAIYCEMDHRVEYNLGGKTEVSNLFCLCKYHHNLKTEQNFHYAHLGERVLEWHFKDGTTVTTFPNGPAAPRRFTGKSVNKVDADRAERRRASNRASSAHPSAHEKNRTSAPGDLPPDAA